MYLGLELVNRGYFTYTCYATYADADKNPAQHFCPLSFPCTSMFVPQPCKKAKVPAVFGQEDNFMLVHR